jgi:hypothetical protein
MEEELENAQKSQPDDGAEYEKHYNVAYLQQRMQASFTPLALRRPAFPTRDDGKVETADQHGDGQADIDWVHPVPIPFCLCVTWL